MNRLAVAFWSLLTSTLQLVIFDNGHTSLALALRVTLGESSCLPVQWNPSAVESECQVFDSACVDHGSRIVTHDQRYQIENVVRENTPGLPSTQWNIPLRANSFPDALGGWQPDFSILVRPVSKVEPTLPLRHPAWSNCTLPVILMVDYPYNYKTFVVKALTDVDNMFRVKGLSPNSDVTLVLATPSGLALEPYHAVLLAPYSRRPLITLADLGRRGMEGLPADWSGEGIRVHCYSKLVACRLNQHSSASPTAAAAAVVSNLASLLPRDPLGFEAPAASPGGGGGDPSPAGGSLVLRVVIEQRTAPWRTIRNMAEILKACQEANATGFSAGPFTAIECRSLPASYNTAPAEPSSIPPGSAAAALFRTALGAVRSAHLFVALAGSSGAHAFFMDPRGPTAEGPGGRVTGSGFVEVRPCGWGSEHASRADGDQDAMAAQLQRGGDEVRFFALNVEDPQQCAPPDYAPQLKAAMESGAMQPDSTVHEYQRKSAPRYTPAELLVRDQYVTLRPGVLLAMLRHAAPLLADKGAYQTTRVSNTLHGYAVPQGLLRGPPGLRDAPQRAQAGPPELIRA